MTAEQEVRAAWELVHRCDGSYRGYPKGTVLVQDIPNHWLHFADWSAAAVFTRERRKQIEEVDEEIAMVKDDIGRMAVATDGPEKDAVIAVYRRILKARQAYRAELARGMKEGA